MFFAITAVILASSSLCPAGAQVFEDQHTASDADFNDQLGGSADVDVDTVILGARAENGSEGAAYVFRRTGGSWNQEDKLTATGGAAQDQVGHDVGLSGDAAILGAPDPFDLFGPASGTGEAYIFRRTGSSWSQEDALTPGGGQSLDQFGSAVDVDGTRAVIGSRGDEASGAGSRFQGRGSAYVFLDNGGGNWSEEDKLIPTGSASGDLVGSSAAISGDFVVLGAPGDDDNGTDAGAAFIFSRSGSNWNQEAKLLAGDGATDDAFGFAVDIDGDLAAVGAYQEDGAGAQRGAVYLYRDNGGAWSQEDKLVASDAADDDSFGVSVAVHGDRVLVGAWGEGSGAGALYLFEKTGPNWNQTAKLTQAGSTLLGSAAALSNDFATGGASLTEVGGKDFAGAGYTWCINPGPILLSVAPNSGLFNVNTPVTLTGDNFSAAKIDNVQFDGVNATSVVVVSPSTITATAPTGSIGQVADVTVNQDGDSSTLVNEYTYESLSLTSLSASSGPAVGSPPVTISGNHFIDDGSTVVTFGGLAANIQSITVPNTMVVDVPVGTRGATVDVAVTSTNGNDTLTNAWTYETLSILALDVGAAHFTGGTTLSVTVDFPTTVGDTTATLGGSPVTVSNVVGSDVQFVTPGIALPDGQSLDITITNSNGSDTLTSAFIYSPALNVGVAGSAAAGGTVSFLWNDDQTIVTTQLVSIWLGDPLLPPLGIPIPGYSGLLEPLPALFVGAALDSSLGALALPYGPLPPAIAGIDLMVQAVVTGEGGPKGTFSNNPTFQIP